MWHYILQTLVCQVLFLVIYDLFLKSHTFFNWNRAYLLITVILSVVLPLIQVEAFKNVVPNSIINEMPVVFIGSNSELGMPSENVLESTVFNWQYVIYGGSVLATLVLVLKISKLIRLASKNPKRWKNEVLIVSLLNSNAAFSFFHYVFLGEQIPVNEKENILKHELIHVQQKHSLDLMLLEVFKITFWFNPLVYMYQSRLRVLHEYIADAQVVKQTSKTEYYQNLLSTVFGISSVSFTNSFFNKSLIKKRIVMLSKTKSNQLSKIKYALVLPIMFGLLVYTSCEKDVVVEEVSTEASITQKIEELQALINSNKGVVSKEDSKKLMRLSLDAVNPNINKKLKEIKESKVLEYENLTEDSEVPFAVIDDVPVYPGCENSANKKQCMSDAIAKHIANNFNTEIANNEGLKGRQRINTIFKIDTNGMITGIRSRAPHPALETEAERVINTLPKMQPGKHKGVAVTVPYSLPIIFQIKE